MRKIAETAIIDALIDGITVTDMQGKVIDFNRAATEQTGYKKEEAIGKTPMEILLAEKDYPRFLEGLGKLLAGKAIESADYLCKRKDGTELPISVSLSLLRDAEGKPSTIIAVHRDITERKRLEQEIQVKNEQLEAQNEELRAANEEMQATEEELRSSNEEMEAANEELRETQEQLIRSEKLAAIGQLAGGVGHELRNPLGAIKNAVYYIKGKVAKSELAQTEPRVVEFLDIVDDEINSSNKIISDLLGFSRVGKPAVSPTKIDKVIEDAISHTTVPENIEITKKLDSSLPKIEIDTDQICQVLVNIITNGAQAMPEGGKLTIEASKKDGFLELKISDTGGGIPDDVIGKIFDPLYTTRAKGIGLGLAVCKSIIDRHDGHINVESSVGKGTTFIIKLPLEGGK
ncbi:ATP-binding protein [Chloroflexota bacterium]